VVVLVLNKSIMKISAIFEIGYNSKLI